MFRSGGELDAKEGAKIFFCEWLRVRGWLRTRRKKREFGGQAVVERILLRV